MKKNNCLTAILLFTLGVWCFPAAAQIVTIPDDTNAEEVESDVERITPDSQLDILQVEEPVDTQSQAEIENNFDTLLNRQLSDEETAAPTVPTAETDATVDSTVTDPDASFTTMDEAQDTAIEDGIIDPDFLLEDGKSYDDYKKVTLRFLNKITGESETFDLETGKTVAYGSLRIRPMSCKKSPPIEEPESTSFLQIWEKVHNAEDQWVFSGWMFASSPSLSAMEHPVYDVWVTDCKD